jgi:TolB-like protein/Flp pilus assembly protein TadD
MKLILAELKRRKVFRVAGVYAAVAFVVWQAADIAFPALGVPEWGITLVVAMAILGFPVALVLAWAFEVTPDGVVRDQPAAPRAVAVDVTDFGGGRKAGYLGLGILVGLVTVGAYTGVRVLGGSDEVERTVAVLPFENLSADPEHAFFAPGFHDELITQLARVSDLTVISRTSVLQYVDTGRNLQEIAGALGVRTVVEGSVQRIGDRLRVNARLVDTRTGRPLWTETYDRQVADAFELQSGVALEIVRALQVRLGADQRQRMQERPTENADAYALYQRGREYMSRPDREVEYYRAAEQLFSRAVELDAGFALAHAELSLLHSTLVHFNMDGSPERREAARAAAERSLALRPDLPEGFLARGMYHYRVHRDYGRALEELERARRGMPNHPEIPFSVGNIQRRQGRFQESIENHRRSIELDPRSAVRFVELAGTQSFFRRWDEVDRLMARAAELAPESPLVRAQQIVNRFDRTGDMRAAEREASALPRGFDPGGQVTLFRWQAALHRGAPGEALERVRAYPDEILAFQTYYFPRTLLEGFSHHFARRPDEARSSFTAAAELLEEHLRAMPGDSRVHHALGFAYAGLGRRDEAVAQARAADALMSVQRDAVWGPVAETHSALVHAWAGDLEGAMARMERLSRVPGGPSAAQLRVEPLASPLRSHPRFGALLEASASPL